ncbi:carbohydrate kinase family protein [Mangrovactinospora gilvigrisea]|uniref:Carbohydrate kinase family protein n=1 Tax=Mangrovactinospora gilvigrisea TaxID=1428644 RepID=A0A1J7BFU2_9ACTN|nr:carbohydrate kinase family protein [Mangrovactinospora gilvigrisea]OIV37551.1 carbohydrate kinase family protein [Mangrovactinospora gilvigrisea]
MRIAVTGSIATDHLMSFPGSFAGQLIGDQLQNVSLSFLVDELDIRRGGVGANICFSMGVLGLNPVLVGAVGSDFAEYRSWLERHGVDCESVHISDTHHTARFVCTTDEEHNQIASFYAGAMAEARNIELLPVAERLDGLDLVLIGADDPDGMVRHTDECRQRGFAFAADPSQQLARMDGEAVKRLVDGAAYLFGNEYERALISQKTGWDEDELLKRVGVRVTTLGAKGARIERVGEATVEVAAVPARTLAEPTGAGDAFRSGFMAGLAWGVSLERCAQLGCLMAVLVVETVGTQEYDVTPPELVERFGAAYGAEAAAEVSAHLAG